MKRKINIIGITLFFTLTLLSLSFCEESITITTYYPSPYGSYNELYVAGNVGIGTTVPNAKLEVAGTLRVTPGLIEGYGSQMTLRSYGTLDLIMNYDGSVGQGEYIRFFGPAGVTELMRIKDNGNVGIGTASPGEKLEVAGNVKATSFIATTAGAGAYKYNTSSNMTVPDYVFDPNYSLMPLDELKKFVEKNRYLPGISSAEELKKNGTASLVEQYLKNLEKIEELYLYVFQLEQRIKQLEKETK